VFLPETPIMTKSEAMGGFVKALSHLGLDQKDMKEIDNPSKEQLKRWHEIRPGNIGNGIVNGKVKLVSDSKIIETNVGHSEVTWSVRGHPTMLKIAESMIGPGDKRVGFDSINIGGKGKVPWFHVDVIIHPYQAEEEKKGYTADVQMMINFQACTKDTGGFVVKPGTHLHHADVVKRASKGDGKGSSHNSNFLRMPIDPETGEYTEPLIASIPSLLVTAPEGAITIWNSKVIHCNVGTTTKSKALFPRMVVYVSYYQAHLCVQSDEKRMQYFKQGVTTNHSPIDATPKTCGWRDKPHSFIIQPYHPMVLNDAQKALIAPLNKWT
jgi:hypothetical protein